MIEIQALNDSDGSFKLTNFNDKSVKNFNFKFSASAPQNDQKQSKIVCLRQKLQSGNDLGFLQKKIQISANDEEVFDSYYDKINALEEKTKKSGARELKPNFILKNQPNGSSLSKQARSITTPISVAKSKLQLPPTPKVIKI